jgi:predicted ester cyclase
MKNLLIGVVLATSLVGCSKKKAEENKEPPAAAPVENTGSAAMAGSAAMTAPPADEKPLAGKDLADKYGKCVGMINDAKYDDFKSNCIAADYKGHEADEGDMASDQIIGMFTGMKTAFPDYKMTPQLVLINGRNILAVELSTGTNSGKLAMPGMPEMAPTNKKVGTLFFHRLAINDQNRATEEWAFEDPITFMGQLGQLPPKAPPVRPATDKSWEGAPNVVVAADDDKEKKNTEVVNKMIADFNAHKPADMLASMADDMVESDQGDAKDNTGKKEIEKSLKMFLTAFPDAKVTADNTFAAGDYVVVMGTFEGTNTGDMGPMKKTGKKVNAHFAEIYKLKDGKVSNLWRFMNGMAMMQQLGMMPPMGAGAGSAAAPAAAGSAAMAPKKK